MTQTRTYDYIIVGGGSAGCVLANRLSDTDDVLLLEAGGSDRALKVRMPAATTYVIWDKHRNWHYETEAQRNLDHRRLTWPRGRLLGGCSSHNLMVYVRGHPSDYDHWRQSGCEGWAYRDVLPYFKRAESFAEADATYHGHSGPMRLRRGDDPNPLIPAFIEAVQQAGHPYTESFSGYQLEGVGRFDHNICKGNRWDTGRAYLWDILDRASLDLQLNAYAHRVLFEDSRAVGVDYRQDGLLKRARASKEVIVCAGAINSPQLLMLSGIGNADELRNHDIQTIVNLPGVGENLQDHLDVAVQTECKKPVSLYSLMPGYRRALTALQWLIRSEGAGATGHSEAGAFLRTSQAVQAPDIQNHFLPMVIKRGNRLPTFHGYQVHVCQLRQASRGYVKLRSNAVEAHPIIEPNYLQTDADVRCMREGVKITREIMAQAAFDVYRGAEISPGEGKNTDAEIDAFVRSHSETCYHPCGTCKMGAAHDSKAVVDPQLRVYGVENLRVADASVMPSVVSANLNATAIMIGEKAADMVAGVAALASEDVPLAEPVPRLPPQRAGMRSVD